MIKEEYIINYGECIPRSWVLTQAEERFIKDKIKASFLQHVTTSVCLNWEFDSIRVLLKRDERKYLLVFNKL
jgi:hypothetical protein